MHDHDDRTPEEKLADLEAEFAEQDRRYEENEKRHKAALIKVLTDLEMARLDVDAITAQLAHLLDHLMAARVVDPDELDEEPQLDVRWLDEEAGVVVVAVWIEGIVYYEHHATGVIYAEREHGGGIEQSIVSDDDGSFGRWHRAAPPRALWVPNALLAEAMDVMAAWGFTYKTNLVWFKTRKDGGPDGRGVGFYFRNVTELVLFGIRGTDNRTLAPGRRQVNLIAERKREHSRKPEQLYDIIEACSPGPRLELFARSERPGWEQWGDELGNYEPTFSAAAYGVSAA